MTIKSFTIDGSIYSQGKGNVFPGDEIKCSYEQYKEKKKCLNSKTKVLKPEFTEKEIDTLVKMCKLCVKYRYATDINLNNVYKFYKHILEVQYGI